MHLSGDALSVPDSAFAVCGRRVHLSINLRVPSLRSPKGINGAPVDDDIMHWNAVIFGSVVARDVALVDVAVICLDLPRWLTPFAHFPIVLF